MTKRSGLTVILLIALAVGPLAGAVKQVRVTAERASVYIEPNRASSRIEIVAKGTVLNLLQESKVKGSWYYVSFNSPRYGSRISGFIMDTMVEPVLEAPPAKETETTRPEAPPAPPQVEEKKEIVKETPAPPKVEEKKEPPKEIPAPPPAVESKALTSLPKGRSFNFPRKEAPLVEAAWKIEEKPLAQEAKPPAPQPVVAQKPEVKVETPPKPPEAEKPPPEEKQPQPAEVKEPVPEKKPEPKPAEPQPVRAARVSPPQKGPGFITVGLGYGSSFGGAGGSLQLNTRMGLSLHAGIGLYPTSLIYSETDWVKNEMMWSVGLKYYLPLSSSSFFPFLDVQYGGQRVEAAQVVIGIWDYNYVMSQEQKSLSGPSFLGGFELRKGRFGITAAAGVAYTTTSWEYLQSKVSLAFDAGLVIHF
jgi:hypothetical protein